MQRPKGGPVTSDYQSWKGGLGPDFEITTRVVISKTEGGDQRATWPGPSRFTRQVCQPPFRATFTKSSA
jgi:hypothetical protein